MITRRLPYAPALDGVRALAVAAVLLYHGGVPWFSGGFLGVDLFFVLSGYLITSLLLAELADSGRIDLKRFWIRRARRLLPAAFLLIAVCLVVAAVFLPGDLARLRGDALAAFAYVNNWHQVLADRSYFSAFERPSLVQHLWSLAIEEQFYLLWPLVLGFCLAGVGRSGTMRLTAVAMVASALAMGLLFQGGADPSRVYFGTDTHASGLLIGCLLAFAWPLRTPRSQPRGHAALVLDVAAVAAVAAIVAAITTMHDYDPLVYRGGLFAVSLATAVLIAAVVHPACHAGRVLGTAPLRWIGERSYGIYLWHWPVMALSRPGTDIDWSRWVLVPLQIAVTVAIAAASYRWVERPVRTGTATRDLRAWLDRRAPRHRLAIVLGALAAAASMIAWVATVNTPTTPASQLASARSAAATADPTPAPAAEPRTPSEHRRPLAVGASVMLAAEPALGRFATVDAAVARQPHDLIARVESYRRADRLPADVIVQVGENGPVWSDDMRALRHALRGTARVVLVNVRVPRSWTGEVNETIARAAASWPQARVADWHRASGRRGVLYDDATHPTPSGRRVYARVVRRALSG
jgi:peptidoglycan/LPS O-acetylase OafA/YrhL